MTTGREPSRSIYWHDDCGAAAELWGPFVFGLRLVIGA